MFINIFEILGFWFIRNVNVMKLSVWLFFFGNFYSKWNFILWKRDYFKYNYGILSKGIVISFTLIK